MAATVIDHVEIKLTSPRDMDDDTEEPTNMIVTFVGHITDGATRYAFSESKIVSMTYDWSATDTSDILDDALASTPFGV